MKPAFWPRGRPSGISQCRIKTVRAVCSGECRCGFALNRRQLAGVSVLAASILKDKPFKAGDIFSSPIDDACLGMIAGFYSSK